MKTKSLGAILGSALVTLSVMAVGTATVNAAVVPPPGSGPSVGCDTQFYGVTANFTGAGYDLHSTGTIVSTHSWLPQSRTIAISLPAGTYDVDAVGYDGSPHRATDAAQPNEQYKLEFLNSAGTIIGTTGITGDLADLVQEATWAGSVGTVTLGEPATQVRAIHAFAGQVIPGSPNSVMPVCLGINVNVPPTTTTAAPTTTTTTAAPTTTTTTAAPTTTTTTAAPTTTTTVKTQVLPAVEVAQTATPTEGNPSFTG